MSRYRYIMRLDRRSPEAVVAVADALFLSLQSSVELAGRLYKGQRGVAVEEMQRKGVGCEAMDAGKGKTECGEMYLQMGFGRIG